MKESDLALKFIDYFNDNYEIYKEVPAGSIRTKSHEQYELEIYDVWGDLVSLIGKYNGGWNKIETKCNKCNIIWNPEAKALLNKHGCPKCGHEKNRNSTVKKHETYVKEVGIKHNNRQPFCRIYA